ncbi:hypothetical protein IPN35_01710 [Candidatus Peregrinibacteria bacterium]|nr:MAG: hypothetical protein IPN35_01710 [Candidatus Peregrinibacteria bacterium]
MSVSKYEQYTPQNIIRMATPSCYKDPDLPPRKKNAREFLRNEKCLSQIVMDIQEFLGGEKRILLLSTSSPSSGGKGKFTKLVQETCNEINIPCVLVESDHYFRTARGSAERQKMTESGREFLRYIYDTKKQRRVLQKIISPKNKGKREEVEDCYENGDFTGSQRYDIPSGKFVLLVEGLNAGIITKNIAQEEDVQSRHIYLLQPPEVHISGVIFRDIREKKDIYALQERISFRIREFCHHLLFAIPNLCRADYIVSDPGRLKKLTKKTKAVQNIDENTIEEIQRIICQTDLLNEVLQKCHKKERAFMEQAFLRTTELIAFLQKGKKPYEYFLKTLYSSSSSSQEGK